MSIEAFVKNMRDKNTDNYETMKRRMSAAFAGMDLEEIESRLSLESDETYLYEELLGRRYRIARADGKAEVTKDGCTWTEAEFSEAMTIYDLLGYAQPDAHPSGEYIQMQNLSRVQNARSYAGEGMMGGVERAWDGKDEALAAALRRLGGEPWGKGDVSFRIPLFRDVKGVVSFWDSDDEFPASLNLSFDKNELMYMHYETVWYLAGMLLRRISEEMEE